MVSCGRSVEVTIGLSGTRARVLAEDLVLRGGLNAGDQRRRNANGGGTMCLIVPALIERATTD